MFVMFLATLVAVLVLLSLRIPAVWLSFMAVDEPSDAHELGLALVAARNPFRESGPPACMAKLIMLRHKLNQNSGRKRRSSPPPSPPPRQLQPQLPRTVYALPPLSLQTRQRPLAWARFPKNFGKQHC